MAWTKQTRIRVMLAIDLAFLVLELVAGIVVHSLALQADAFHMLNDIISLLVGDYAVRLARQATTDKYTYGWLRAEILGAFFNAVFLIALCVSISLDALARFIEPPKIDNPKLILIVGCLGLLSNIVGFFVLGGHGHSHGNEEHEHGEDHQHEHNLLAQDDLGAAEQGQAHAAVSRQSEVSDEDGRVADLLPEAAVGRWNAAAADAQAADASRRIRFDGQEEPSSKATERRASRSSNRSRGRSRRSNSLRQSRLANLDDLSIHPSSFRQEIIAASRPRPEDDESSSDSAAEEAIVNQEEAGERTPLLGSKDRGKATNGHAHRQDRSTSRRNRRDSDLHRHHNHNKPRKAKSGGHHGHSHGDMGMNAMILHVIGDMLGNVGVIVTALIIWLTDWSGKYYADPAVSLFIAVIILRSAVPLTMATAKILLQATPDTIDVNDVREDIQQIPGIVSCHHVHIWQLTDTKIVASMHIQVAFPISAEGGGKYMELARVVRKCLHAYGIHSATIQPEFCQDKGHDHGEDVAMTLDGTSAIVQRPKDDPDLCLLECVDNCDVADCCVVVGSKAGSKAGSTHSAPGDGHHGHSH